MPSNKNTEDLEAIRCWSTCAVSNGIELFDKRPRNKGFIRSGISCLFPELGPMIGYAVTAVTSTNLQEGHKMDMFELWECIQRMPRPSVVVTKDIDYPVVGAFWGEVRANVSKALGCVGVVSDGAVRDLEEVKGIGLHYFSKYVSVSHAYNRLLDVNVPIEIGGLVVKPGDLIMGDKHGIISIPSDVAKDIPKAAQLIEDWEHSIISFCKSKAFTLEGLKEKYSGGRPTWPRK